MNLINYSIEGINTLSRQSSILQKMKEMFILFLIVFLGFLGTSFIFFGSNAQQNNSNFDSICIHQMDIK